MKTLYEQLSEKHKQKLQKEYLKYPNSVGSLLTSLRANESPLNLTMKIATDLMTFLFINEPFDLIKYYNLFKK